MYYSNGNYEAFARPQKPADVDKKSAYLVGAGLASLSAAAFLLRDGQMKGENIHIFEELSLPGGSLDGAHIPGTGFSLRGGREMENHFECLWDLFRSVPSLEIEDASVLDEFYWLNKKDPNFSNMRAIQDKGQDAHTDGKFTLSDKAVMELIDLFMTPEDQLDDKRISDVFSEDFFDSNFWLYWRTMFAFEPWHSAMEMRRYIARFIHHIGGLPDFSALKFTKYNQYESLVMPLVKHLEAQGVQFAYDTTVTNVVFEISVEKKIAKRLEYTQKGEAKTIQLSENDLVFVTNGSITESSTLGSHSTSAALNTAPGGSWELWKNIAVQHTSFGHPEKFCNELDKTNFVSATLTTLDDQIPPYIQKICQRDPFNGGTVTGGIVTIKDSNWLLSFTVNRQPQFHDQPKDQLVIWLYGLFSDVPGNYVPKVMQDCTGMEIAMELLYHLGVPQGSIEKMAENSTNCIPCMLPYVMSYFMPRAKGDRPDVVPEGCVNFAFIGNFAETERDTVFTTEYSVRTAMEAVYQLLKVDRGVPEVFASCFDARVLLNSSARLLDGRKLTDIKLPFLLQAMEKQGLKKIEGTIMEDMLKEYGLI